VIWWTHGERRRARVQAAQRDQVEWRTVHLDGAIAEHHRARTIWKVMERLDLTALHDEIGAPRICSRCTTSRWPGSAPR
jgi:hypothetical protein